MEDEMDREELGEWLKSQPREVAVAIASREAIRIAARLTHFDDTEVETRRLDNHVVNWFRCLLTGAAISKMERKQLIRAASTASEHFAFHTETLVEYTTNYLFSAGAFSHAAFRFLADEPSYLHRSGVPWDYSHTVQSANADANMIADGVVPSVLMNYRLFLPHEEEECSANIEALLFYLRGSNRTEFWSRWYDRMIAGNPMNWDMQAEIALIDYEVWNAGAEAVAAEIAEIEARYLAKATPYAEKIEINQATGKLHSVSFILENENLYQTALDKVRDAIGDLKEGEALPQHCSALAPVVKKLERTLGAYADNPQRVHDDFLSVSKEVDRQLTTKEVGDYPEVQGLRTDLITGSDDIRAADPDVRASVAARLRLRIEEMRVEDTEQVAEVLDQVAASSEGELAQSTAEDAETLRAIRYVHDGGAPELGPANPDETVDAIYRSAARTSRISSSLGALVEKANKAADGYDKGQKLVALGRGISGIIGYLLRLLM